MEKVIENDVYEMYKLVINFRNIGHFTNTYILKDKKTGLGVLIDPAYNDKYIIECLEKLDVKLDTVYLTHCHADHTHALENVYCKYKELGVKIKIHKLDKLGVFDEKKNCAYIVGNPDFTKLDIDDITEVNDQEILKIGNILLTIYHTPGHTNGSSVLYEKTENILITGDTLFSDCYGRCDLESGSNDDMNNSLNKLFNDFLNGTRIFPGHGDSSTLENAKLNIQ